MEFSVDAIGCSRDYSNQLSHGTPGTPGTPDSPQSQRTYDENTFTEGSRYEIVSQESVKTRRINVIILPISPLRCTSFRANCPNSTAEHRIELHNALIVNEEKKSDRSLKMRSKFGKISAKNWTRRAKSSTS